MTTMRRMAGAALVVCGLLLGAAQGHAGLPRVTSGHRPGPDALYRPAASAPQLENASPWAAKPLLVSGAAAYHEGEFVYQDFLYDDHGSAGTTDPTDPVFANNAADLVELRVTPPRLRHPPRQVRFVAVADRRLIRKPRALRRYLRLAGL